MRIEGYYIEHEVECGNCGKTYIPSKQEGVKELQVPFLFVNNFCSRICMENMADHLTSHKAVNKGKDPSK